MTTGDRVATFMRKMQEFDSLIKFASRRYHIPGVLDPDDLYQEGLMILDKMLRDDYTYQLDPDSIDFRKMFKTELWHGLWKVLQRFKTQKRDHRMVLNKDYSQVEKNSGKYRSTAANELDEETSSSVFSGELNPEQVLEFKEKVGEVDFFLDLLVEQLDDEARVVLHELLFPRSWDEIPDDCKANAFGDEYWRTPKRKIPQPVLARMLDWPLIRVRRAISRIRKQSAALGDLYGFDLLTAAGVNLKQKRRRRKNVRSVPEGVPSSSVLQPAAGGSGGAARASNQSLGVADVLSSTGSERSGDERQDRRAEALEAIVRRSRSFGGGAVSS